MIPRETDFTKQDSSSQSDHAGAIGRSAASTSSWSRFKDPRVVRMPKAYGGKDRHSKVCTVRGLRDRRVRLSVPTAIQLYDLQDRLGLNQPSKVVDWLLNAAKHEIDELPPLQIPPTSTFHQILASQVDKYSLKLMGSTGNWNDPLKHPRTSVLGENDADGGDTNWNRAEQERRFIAENQDAYVSDGHNFPSRNQHLSVSGLMSSPIGYNPYGRFDPSSLSLSHPPRNHGSTDAQIPEDCHNFGAVPMPGSHHQVLVYQHGIMSTQSYFPSQIASTSSQYDPKPVNFQSSASCLIEPSSTQPVRPIHFMNMTASLFPSQNDDAYEQSKGNM